MTLVDRAAARPRVQPADGVDQRARRASRSAGAPLQPRIAGRACALAMSLFYVGGMYLNDAFDARVDAQQRPERPIPSGEVSRGTVLAVGYALLGVGFVVLAVVGGEQGALGGAVLAGLILVYDAVHRRRPSRRRSWVPAAQRCTWPRRWQPARRRCRCACTSAPRSSSSTSSSSA